MFEALASESPKCLTFRDQLLDRACDIFHRHSRIDAVLVEQVDVVGPQPLQRTFDHVAEVLGAAVEVDDLALVEAELCADENLVAHRLQRLAHPLLVDERTKGFRGVE
jgi:hypothetical protein